MPELWANFALTYAGAVALYVLTRTNNLQPFSILRGLGLLKARSAPWLVLADMLGSCLLGSILAYALTQPQTLAQAAMTGLAMSGLLSSYAK